jgi:hypothetical protein
MIFCRPNYNQVSSLVDLGLQGGASPFVQKQPQGGSQGGSEGGSEGGLEGGSCAATARRGLWERLDFLE